MSETGLTARELLRRDASPAYRPIPTFVQGLDKILGGGIKPGLITEFYGDCGIGKTTMCIQLCIDVQIPEILQGLEGEALFIDTENTFVVNRVKDMARGFVNHCASVIPKDAGFAPLKISVESVMNGIHVVKCTDMAHLEKITLAIENYLKRNRKIRIIVIDSIAFPYYTVEEGFGGRNQPLYGVGQVLHHLAAVYNVAIVVTNNLTTRFDSSGGEYFVPFLGESWYNIPNQRIKLHWKNEIRTAQIIVSSHVPTAEACFKVTGVGIRE